MIAERRAAAPTVDLSLFRIPAFAGGSVAIVVANLGTFGVFLYTSLYFQQILGYSPVEAGAALLPWILMLIVIGPFTGKLAERVPPRILVAAGLAVMAGGLLALTGVDEHSSYGSLLPGLVIGGLGGALTIPLSAAAAAGTGHAFAVGYTRGLAVSAALVLVGAVVVAVTLREPGAPAPAAVAVPVPVAG